MRSLILLLLLICPAASAQDFFAPVYSPKDHWTWNALKITSYAATSADAKSTTDAIRSGCCVEGSPLVNWAIPKDSPAFWRRQAYAFGIQYGMNAAMELAYRRAHTKKEKILVYAMRGALIGASAWMAKRNNDLR